MALICNKIKSGECDKLSCSHAKLHKLNESKGHTNCLNPNCSGWKEVRCESITEVETYVLRILYGIRIVNND